MAEHDKKSEGLIGKFKVERIAPSSRGIDHSGCRYFVLDPQHDPMALDALQAYQISARADGYDELANDLRDWIKEIRADRDAEVTR